MMYKQATPTYVAEDMREQLCATYKLCNVVNMSAVQKSAKVLLRRLICTLKFFRTKTKLRKLALLRENFEIKENQLLLLAQLHCAQLLFN